MAKHNLLGKHGEELAVEFLISNHYKILETNWRFRKAEVDIIAEKENILIIVEVKTRVSDYFGKPEEFISKSKQRLLTQAADAYIELHQLNHEVRFDVISIVFRNKSHAIDHIEDAFYPFASDID